MARWGPFAPDQRGPQQSIFNAVNSISRFGRQDNPGFVQEIPSCLSWRMDEPKPAAPLLFFARPRRIQEIWGVHGDISIDCDSQHRTIMYAKRYGLLQCAIAMAGIGVALSWASSVSLTELLVPRSAPLSPNVYRQHYAIDGHAHWAEAILRLVRNGFRDADWEAFRSRDLPDMRGRHSTHFSIVGPAATAGIALATGDIVMAYRLSSVLATLLGLLLMVRILLHLGARPQEALFGACLFLSNYSVIRSWVALQQDPWAVAGFAVVVERAIAIANGGRVWTLLMATALCTFTKANAIVAGVLFAAIYFSCLAFSPPKEAWRWAGVALIVALTPMAVLFAFLLPFGGASSLLDYLDRNDQYVAFSLMDLSSLALVGGVHFVFLARTRLWVKSPLAIAGAGSAIVYIAFLALGSRISTRLVSPIVILLVIATTISMSNCKHSRRWLIGNGAVSIALVVISILIRR